ncbi:KamA family radical SAM protein [Roseovarius salis]|uniref:KamA family radical SAM protein n=1 Tax=Roseovarius salis TaxID=3376063 RepID=UPI0037CA362C
MQITPIADRYKAIGAEALHRLPQANRLPEQTRHALNVVSRVFPFRVNTHVTSNLIDWDSAPDDPVFRLVFPARDMLLPEDFRQIEQLVENGASAGAISLAANQIRARLNPHPSGQREHNVPSLDGEPVEGFQHKYRETVLYFPARGQTCHAYCTFCFRWAQFVGDPALKFASKEVEALRRYLRAHPEISDVLFTGGDPMIMATHHLAEHIEPLLAPEFDTVQSIRVGTKSLTFWPQRFVTDPDADALLRLIEKVTRKGRNFAVMAHVNHWRELDNSIAQRAIRRLRDAGATLNSQAPLLARINDHPDIWARNWREQVTMGIHPYYMFIERDTGPRHYFEVPLRRAFTIYRDAIQQVSGLARSARGPVMSADPGKVEVLDVDTRPDRSRFLLQFLQARDPVRARHPFWAEGDHNASWFSQLARSNRW